VALVAGERSQAPVAHFSRHQSEHQIPQPAERSRLDLKQGPYPS